MIQIEKYKLIYLFSLLTLGHPHQNREREPRCWPCCMTVLTSSRNSTIDFALNVATSEWHKPLCMITRIWGDTCLTGKTLQTNFAWNRNRMHMYVHYFSPTNWLSNKLPKHIHVYICYMYHFTSLRKLLKVSLMRLFSSVGTWELHLQRLCPRCGGPGFESWPGRPLLCVFPSLSLIPFPVISSSVLSKKDDLNVDNRV